MGLLTESDDSCPQLSNPAASCITHYEQQRNARLSENRKRMEALGLVDLSRSLADSPAPNATTTGVRKKMKGRGGLSTNVAVDAGPLLRRRSSRLLGTTLPSYEEVAIVKDCAVASDTRQRQPEVYTEEHEKLLGHCAQDWELFKDGYAADGTRIYDSEKGKTCHQCRQKTLGLRTWCNQCKSLRGQFCGDCLFMRYGENVVETSKNKYWACPGCRGICNCSCCRIKKGWAPTGSMYRLALKLNFKSVAHYLVMTRRGLPQVESDEDEKPKAAPEGGDTEDTDEATGVRRSLTYCA